MTIDTVRGHRRTLRWPFASGSFDMTRPLTLALGASLLGATLLAGCATTAQTGGAQAGRAGDPYPSPYAPIASPQDRKSTVELQSLMRTSYAVFCLKTKHKAH